jgi:hypothetical protein
MTLREAARNLMLYADECALILKATHPAKAQSLDARVAAVAAALKAEGVAANNSGPSTERPEGTSNSPTSRTLEE